jgi:hypothetical protein
MTPHQARVETLALQLDYADEDSVARFYRRMIDDAEPGREPIVTKFTRQVDL